MVDTFRGCKDALIDALHALCVSGCSESIFRYHSCRKNITNSFVFNPNKLNVILMITNINVLSMFSSKMI